MRRCRRNPLGSAATDRNPLTLLRIFFVPPVAAALLAPGNVEFHRFANIGKRLVVCPSPGVAPSERRAKGVKSLLAILHGVFLDDDSKNVGLHGSLPPSEWNDR